MSFPLKYATASQEVPLGYFLDSTDGDSEETGLTIANTDIKLWKSGATTLANKNSGGATHIANGVYYATLDATDTDTYGPLVVFVHVAGALTVRLECVVMESSAYDALYAAAGSGHIEADVVQWKGSAAPANTGDAFARIGATGSGLTSLASAAAATAIEADTQDIQSRLPAALDGGYIPAQVKGMDANTVAVGVIAADAVDAVAISADAGNEIADKVRQRTLTEGYAAPGAAPTLEQALMMAMQGALEFSISGTTITVKQLDGTTTAMTFTLDDGSNPTSRARAT